MAGCSRPVSAALRAVTISLISALLEPGVEAGVAQQVVRDRDLG
jgi:hypothetical protein